MGLLVLALAASDLTADTVRGLLDRAALGPLLGGAAAMCAGLVFLALRWRAMMPDRDRVQVLPLTGLYLVGTLLNYALPGPVGEFVAAAMAGRRFGIPGEQAFAAGVHARFLGLSVAGAIAGTLYLFADLPVPEGLDTWIAVAVLAIGGGAVALGALSAWPRGLELLSAALFGRFALTTRLHAAGVRLARSMEAVGRLGVRTYATGALWALCGHGCVISGIWLVAYALGAAPPLAGVAFTYMVATAGAVVLFAFPGAQLGWDAMFASLLVTTAGMPVADALAVTLVVRAQQLMVVAAGAGVLLRQLPALGDESTAAAR